ncbi:hypothetical protein A2Z33_04475 [Candidatus Gottesmanbacteria bacterium RBG_16_52_11]|uniref:Uncharacterized protein n=1 Tax=Candidatus Gottesmanbacteria bacterium RBG_16_52_11 TaxID=1798374 RepID=A0A1F5YW22_9BACT|nr:MAG: hypothetical protein A2Z33_04475 [Candidatus Gottesmanbacteria bacterium RBG_16_52_11]
MPSDRDRFSYEAVYERGLLYLIQPGLDGNTTRSIRYTLEDNLRFFLLPQGLMAAAGKACFQTVDEIGRILRRRLPGWEFEEPLYRLSKTVPDAGGRNPQSGQFMLRISRPNLPASATLDLAFYLFGDIPEEPGRVYIPPDSEPMEAIITKSRDIIPVVIGDGEFTPRMLTEIYRIRLGDPEVTLEYEESLPVPERDSGFRRERK